MYDCIVIGSGPSGISAAIYLKRFGFNVLVIGMDEGTLKINTTTLTELDLSCDDKIMKKK